MPKTGPPEPKPAREQGMVSNKRLIRHKYGIRLKVPGVLQAFWQREEAKWFGVEGKKIPRSAGSKAKPDNKLKNRKPK